MEERGKFELNEFQFLLVVSLVLGVIFPQVIDFYSPGTTVKVRMKSVGNW